jgi:hypothetical protein
MYKTKFEFTLQIIELITTIPRTGLADDETRQRKSIEIEELFQRVNQYIQGSIDKCYNRVLNTSFDRDSLIFVCYATWIDYHPPDAIVQHRTVVTCEPRTTALQ